MEPILKDSSEQKQTSKQVAIDFSVQFPIIECDCGHRFVLIGLLSVEDSGKEEWKWINQESCEYCPYCGRKNK